MKRYITRLLAKALPIMMLTGALASCNGDDPGDDIVVMSQASVTVAAPRAADGAAVNEKMHELWVALVDNDGAGKVVELIHDRFDTPTDADQTYTLTIPSGNYAVYALANMPADSIVSGAPLGIVKGESLPDGFTTANWRHLPAAGDPVPMSGHTRARVNPLLSDDIRVQAVRMCAKLTFRFTTDTERPLHIGAVAVDSALALWTPRFPDYDVLNGYKAFNIDKSLLSPLTLDLGEGIDLVPGDGPVEHSLYLLESSMASHPTRHYVLRFTTTPEGGEEHTHTALTLQLDSILRNDHVTIPVRFTDYNIDLDIRFYPPIGGYPAVIKESKGDEYFARFATSGYFEIVPRVTDYSGRVYSPADYTLSLTLDSDPGDLFGGSAPQVQTSGEITGEILADRPSDTPPVIRRGTATLMLELQINDGKLGYPIKRKLHIVRED